MRRAVHSLGVPLDELVLAGSAPLVACGAIEAAGDLDLVALGSAWAMLAARGKVTEGALGDRVVDLPGGIQVFSGWHGEDAGAVTAAARTVDGLHVLDLAPVIAYKRRLDRPKDRVHLAALTRWARSPSCLARARRLADRREAGTLLACTLADAQLGSPIVLALPRGGVPVAAPLARALDSPLGVLVVRKLGVPWNPEYAFGALGEGGATVIDDSVVAAAGLSADQIATVVAEETAERDRRIGLYRPDRAPLDLTGRTAIIVDDGAATGATALAAIAVSRALGAAKVLVAVGVASPETLETLSSTADAAIAAVTASPFHAVGQWYEDFAQTTDDEVRALLGLT